ncbi:hypothetical protein [Geopseudomonas aromaticivorans]
MNKIHVALLTLPLLAAGIVAGANQYLARGPMIAVIQEDSRNAGIDMRSHLQHYVDPTSLVIDIHGITGDHSAADVFRVVNQYAAAQKERDFKRVILSFRGEERFMLKGEFFKQTGAEYGDQNPMYTLRTFPQNVYRMDGTQAYDTWEGGWLGVLGKQMADFGEFSKAWYMTDLLNGD